MSKKLKLIILVSLISLLVGGTITITILSLQNNKETIISYTNYNSFVYTDTKTINLGLYTNKEDSKFMDTTSYNNVSISDNNQYNLVSLDLLSISKSNTENYNNQLYYKFILILDMPEFETNFHISNAYINIELKNFESYTFYIGTFDLLYYDFVGVENYLSINSIFARKNANTYLSRIYQIELDITLKDNVNFLSFSLGSFNNITYSYNNNLLVLTINKEDMAMSNVPIIINMQLQTQNVYQVIDNFTYFDEFDFLNTNGPLLHVYALN